MHPLPVPHDIIRFFPKSKERIFEVCAPLYERGCSLREIEEQTGFAKTSIGKALVAHGLPLRKRVKEPSNKKSCATKMRSPILPYGYAWLEGELVRDPREYKVVLKVLKLWSNGKSLSAIARELNAPASAHSYAREMVSRNHSQNY